MKTETQSLVQMEHACHLATTFAFLMDKPHLTDAEYNLLSRLSCILNSEE